MLALHTCSPASGAASFPGCRPAKNQHRRDSPPRCRAAPCIDYDLYDLLGIDRASDQIQIKTAYRLLQKRCHPDIAGAAGHDMAIVLNEAYAVLSDPDSRYLYDLERSKTEGLRGYTGKPLYSAWMGAEGEQRAVFVDEVRCVGCLKCALLAGKTFAIESVYGRARVVAQWADAAHRIHDAIQACPVDCISMVERSKLPALEFLMSKQPRGNVRVGAGNAVGTRVGNIFVEAEKFETRFRVMKQKTTERASKGTDPRREARMAAVQAIRTMTNWWFWEPPTPTPSRPRRNSTLLPEKATVPDPAKVREVAARRRAEAEVEATPTPKWPTPHANEEYWAPPLFLPSPSQNPPGPRASAPYTRDHDTIEAESAGRTVNEEWNNPFNSNVPIVMATFAAVSIGLSGGGTGNAGLQEHIGGALALQVVNSSLLQTLLAGVTWYLLGVIVVGVIGIYAQSLDHRRDQR